MTPRKHYVQQNGRRTLIPYQGEKWQALQAWYVANGFNLETTIDTGSTVVEDGHLYVTTLKPIDGQTPTRITEADNKLTRYEYRLPVTPLPEKVLQ